MTQTKHMKPAVFLDRDGTLIEDRGHLRSCSDVAFFPQSFHSLRRLQRKFLLFIVTNQPGVAEGALRPQDVDRVNAHVLSRLAEFGVEVTELYVCPHRRSDRCACIKPNPLFLRKAAEVHKVDLSRSYVVGDHPHDVDLARNVGARGVYMLTGHGAKHRHELSADTVIVPGIREAADWILARHELITGPGDLGAKLSDAVQVIREGGVAAFPTETVYGLGADALDAEAVARVFEIKQRPRFDPLIVHVAELGQAKELVEEMPDDACRLADRFWPGPLTLVLPKKGIVPDIVTAGLPTVAVRMPDHPLALMLIRGAGTPIAAPSANRFGRISPTTAEDVQTELGEEVDIIVDGGPCPVGVESTVLSFCENPSVLLRPGGLPLEEIEQAIGPVRLSPDGMQRPLAPGQLSRHYAPRTPLVLGFSHEWELRGRHVGLLAFRQPQRPDTYAAIEVLSASGDLREAATNLFGAMRRLDSMGLDFILAEPVPQVGLGHAVMDRLRKASAPRRCCLQSDCVED